MTESGESSRFCEKLSRMKLFNAKSEGRWTWRSRLGGQRQRRANSRFVPPSLAECWLGLRTALAQGRNNTQTPKPKTQTPNPKRGSRCTRRSRRHATFGEIYPSFRNCQRKLPHTGFTIPSKTQSCSNNRCRICE